MKGHIVHCFFYCNMILLNMLYSIKYYILGIFFLRFKLKLNIYEVINLKIILFK
jgi:hypothetical protein